MQKCIIWAQKRYPSALLKTERVYAKRKDKQGPIYEAVECPKCVLGAVNWLRRPLLFRWCTCVEQLAPKLSILGAWMLSTGVATACDALKTQTQSMSEGEHKRKSKSNRSCDPMIRWRLKRFAALNRFGD